MRSSLIIVAFFILVAAGYLHFQTVAETFVPEPVESPTEEEENEPATAHETSSDGSDSPQDDEEQLRQEAEEYVSEIIEHEDNTVEVESADDFISRDEPIALLAGKQYETRTLNQLQEEMKPDAPLTIVRQQEQVEMTTAKDLLTQSGGNLNAPVLVLDGGDVRETTIGEIIENRDDPEAPVSVIRETEHLEITTVRELMQDDNLAADQPLKVIREPYRLQSTTINELLMGEDVVSENSIFYIRNITEDDTQGLWGIVHNGLVKNFASGIALRRGQKIRKYQVDIPTDADERLADQSSSFLGKMIDRKTHESFVYNYQQGKMGKSPDIIHPGQEIVLIGFTPEELYRIYEHFVTRSESRS